MAWWQIIFVAIGGLTLLAVLAIVGVVIVAGICSRLDTRKAHRCGLCSDLISARTDARVLRDRMAGLGIKPGNRCGRVKVAQTLEAGYYETVATWDDTTGAVAHPPIRVTEEGEKL